MRVPLLVILGGLLRLASGQTEPTSAFRDIHAWRRVVGQTRPAPSDWIQSGRWLVEGDTKLWRAQVAVHGAQALRLHINGFQGQGGLLRIRDGASGQLQASYSDSGPFGDGDFWTPTLFSSSAVVEFLPEAESPAGVPPFQLIEVAVLNQETQDKQRERAVGFCQLDATNYPQWQTAADSVALLLAQLPDGKWGLCTGTLVAGSRADGRPLLLTAHHCVGSEAAARSVETYWRFQRPANQSWDPQWRYDVAAQLWNFPLAASLPRIAGARLLETATASEGDMSLLELSAPAPSGATFSRLNPEVQQAGVKTTGVHHPDGSWKRISFGVLESNAAGIAVYDEAAGWLRMRPRDYFYQMRHSLGVTEAGSSGSGLFTEDGRLSAVLSFGASSCGFPMSADYYGVLSVFYPRIQSFLGETAPGACAIRISAVNQVAPAAGAAGAFQVEAPAQCRWAVAADHDWITVSPRSGSGNATISYSVAPNPFAPPRNGSISIFGERRRVVHVMEKGSHQAPAFDDVNSAHPYFDYIRRLQLEGALADPCTASRFCPEAAVTRGVMAQFIIRAIYGGDAKVPWPAATPYFRDVPPTHPQYRWIQEMKRLAITEGCSRSDYCPEDPVTRGQMAVFVMRALSSKNAWGSRAPYRSAAAPYFIDVPPEHPFYDAIQKLKELGITSGCQQTAFCPDATVTRAQVAVFLVRGLFTLWEGRGN